MTITLGRSLLSAGGIALVVALGACGKIEQNDPQDASRVRAEAKRQQTRCASSVAYDRLKGLLFDEATTRFRGNRANLDTLADYSTARMEAPVVDSRDAALDITGCKGRFILEIPPGAERAFGGERRLAADISYTAQAAADGNGFVYKLSGAEPIVARLAAFNLTSGAFQPPPAIDAQAGTAMAQADTTAPLPNPAPAAPVATAPVATAPVARAPVAVAAAPPPPPRPQPPQSQPPRSQPTRPQGPIAPIPVRGTRDTPASGGSGEDAVRAFYAALGAGNGNAAAARIIPEKRGSGAFSPAAMTRFYGKLAEPVRLGQVTPVGGGKYRVNYSYSTGRSRCNGSAIVSVTNRDGGDLIRSIRALNGC